MQKVLSNASTPFHNFASHETRETHHVTNLKSEASGSSRVIKGKIHIVPRLSTYIFSYTTSDETALKWKSPFELLLLQKKSSGTTFWLLSHYWSCCFLFLSYSSGLFSYTLSRISKKKRWKATFLVKRSIFLWKYHFFSFLCSIPKS